jgi:hypothetical protein
MNISVLELLDRELLNLIVFPSNLHDLCGYAIQR